jgi:hypothetical protein
VVRREEVDGGEALDGDARLIVLGGIKLGDHDLLLVGEPGGHLFVDGDEVLAMAAPWWMGHKGRQWGSGGTENECTHRGRRT